MLKTCVKKQGCYGSKDPEADHGNGLETNCCIIHECIVGITIMSNSHDIDREFNHRSFEMVMEKPALHTCD